MRFNSVKYILLIMTGSFMILIGSCTKDSGPIVIRQETDTISFNDTIMPILQANCIGSCHPPFGNLDLNAQNAYANLVNVPSLSPGPIRVTPFQPENSMLYLRVAGSEAGGRMPQGQPPLTSGEIGLIYDWIAQGALDN